MYMHYYCFTIRKCSPAKTVKTVERTMLIYESYLNYLKRMDEKMEVEYHYECVTNLKGSFNVHLHAMLKTPSTRTPYVKHKKGYSIRLEKCQSPTAWKMYITKDNKTKDDIINYVSHTITVTPTLTATNDTDSEDLSIPDAPEMNVLYKKKLFS